MSLNKDKVIFPFMYEESGCYDVIKAIKTLEKGKILLHDHWGPGKVKLIKPTTLGTEIIDLLVNLDQYRTNSKKLEEAKCKLNSFSGKHGEIWNNWHDGLRFTDSVHKKDFLLALAYRYALIYYQYELNQISDTILIRIIADQVVEHLSERKNTRLKELLKNRIIRRSVLQPLLESITHDIFCIYTHDFHLSSCKLISQQVTDLLSTLLRIAKISKFELVDSINLAENQNVTEKDMEKYNDQDYVEYLSDLLRNRNYVPYGPYNELPNSNELRQKDKEELISIYKNILPKSGPFVND